MDFYFTDRKFNLLEIISTEGTTPFKIVDDKETRSITAGSRALEGTIVYTDDQAKRVSEIGALGNYILYVDEDGRGNFQTIVAITGHNNLNGRHEFTAENSTNDLLNETVDAYSADKAYPIATYINKFTADSGFEIGVNEISNLSRNLKWDSTDETALARILSVATQFDVELDFTFEFTGTRVSHRYINIHKHIGADKDVRLTQNKEINSITTTGDIYDLATSIQAIGGTPEGADKPITLDGYKYTDPTGRYVLRGQMVLDTVANRTWTRLLGGGTPSTTGAYLNRVITYTAVTQAELMQSVLTDLKKRAQPNVNYDVDIAILPPGVDVGDTVHIVDENEELYLSSRILELEISRSTGIITATLGDYVVEENQVNVSLTELANQLKELANRPVYTWIAYADDASGSGISLFANDKDYVGMAVNMADKETDISDPSKFNWQLTKGEPGKPGKDGSNGIPGAKGEDGRTSYFHTAWADSVNGSIGFTASGGNGKKYVGTYSDFTKEDSTEPSKYNWALFKGVDGKDGYTPIKGADYFDGKDGQDGKSSYLWIRYSANSDGTDMTSDPIGAKYVGYATTQTTLAPTLASAYKWQLVAGKDGIPGEKGTDGKTSYLHIRYSNDGGKTFTANSGETVGTYIGQYTDFTQSDSNSVSAYKWALIKGEKGDTGADGVAGKDGVGIKSTAVTYQASTSGTTQPTGTWSATVPNTSKGQYLWTRTVWTYTDNTTEIGYSVSYIAKDGNNGSDGVAGKDGVGIKSTTITYASSTSGTTAPTSGWVSTPPSAAAGQFIWTRTIWTYTDNTTETGYSVGKIGEKGSTGSTGNGVKSTAVTYQSSTSGVTPPTGTWSTSIPSVGAGHYLWTRTITTYTDGTSTTMYAVGMMGATGPKGDPGSKDVPVITSGTSFPSTRKTGDMHWMTNSSGVVIGYYKFNGSQWVVQKIDAQSLNVSSLSALSANLGNVTAGTINGVNINGAEFHESYNGVIIDGEGEYATKSTGEMIINDGSLTISGDIRNVDNVARGQRYITKVSPSGFRSLSTMPDGTTTQNEVYISFGRLTLSEIVSLDGVNSKYMRGDLRPENLLQLNNVGQLLWQGAIFMDKTQMIIPSTTISNCLNGWVLLWSQYNTTTNTVGDAQWQYTYIQKTFVTNHSGNGVSCSWSDDAGNGVFKYIYVKDNSLTGYAFNDSSYQRKYVLREVHSW